MKKSLLVLAFAGLSATLAFADDAPFSKEIKARQGIMTYRAINIGTLAGMAKGDVPYDAAAAKVAADALASSGHLDMSMIWPMGSDNSANPASTANAAIWADGSDIMDKNAAFVTAADAMAAAAGTDLASLQGAMDALGGSCGACHKAYRVPQN